jgi:hypothetical protein
MLDDQFKRLEEKIRKSVVAVASETAAIAHDNITAPIGGAGALSPIGSPIWTGLYQANNNVGLNAADTTLRAAGAGRVNVREAVKPMKLGDSVILSNNLSYAKKLDREPSPLEKTEGKMYWTSLRMAMYDMRTYRTREVCKDVDAKSPAARTHKIEVNL